jgi:hypothetical protein
MRTKAQVGDIYEVLLDEGKCGYFQHIAYDETQLSSAVIRVFDGTYDLEAKRTISEITSKGVIFYAHVFLKAGYVLKMWKRVGNADYPSEVDVTFRSSCDYGNPSVKVSNDWEVWKVNKPRKKVGKLPEVYWSAEIGAVMSPPEIAKRMLTGEYSATYPGFR